MDVATTTTAYDDRPISMYDNLNVTNNNVNTTSTPKIKQPSTTETSSSSSSSSTSPPSKPNGAVRSATAAAAATTPFAHITFKFNDNNNTTTTNHQQHQQQQLPPQPYQMVNGNRNLNQQMSPNMAQTPGSGVAALYATPFKMVNTTPISQKPAITTSPPAQTAVPASGGIAGIGNALTSPLQQPSTTSSSSSSSQTPAVAVAATLPSAAATATANTTRSQTERPLSQHSQSELNETTHSIAAVKAALNEAKSKFFGLNGYAASAADLPQQLQHPSSPADESQTEHLLPTIDHSPRIQPQQLQLQLQPQHHQRSAVQPPPVQTKPQPKYQNIPENSALFRNTSPGGSVAPELPPKPLEYQNLNKPATATPTPSVHNINNNNNKSTVSSSPSPPPSLDTQNSRKMPDGTIYNQISLNDIDGPSHRSQVSLLRKNNSDTSFSLVEIQNCKQNATDYYAPIH